MEIMNKYDLSSAISSLEMPRYGQLPDVGLYLEQTAKYINKALSPLGCVEITPAMIRNYVKMGLVKNPVQKAYYADHIAHLISITILKLALPLENIRKMFELQEVVYTDKVAYDYFCMELENMVFSRFELSDGVREVGETSSMEKEMLRSAIIAISHIIYLNSCFRLVSQDGEEKKNDENTMIQEKNDM